MHSELDPKFAAYEPGIPRRQVPDVAIRDATPADAEGIAQVHVERHGTDLDDVVPRVLHDLQLVANGERQAYRCVAVHDGAIAGFANCDFVDSPTPRPAARHDGLGALRHRDTASIPPMWHR